MVSNNIVNSTNPIDKVNFNIIKTKNLFNFFLIESKIGVL